MKKRKIISIIISTSVAVVPLCAFAGDVNCSINGRSLTVSGIVETEDTYVSGAIAPKLTSDGGISAEGINSGDIIAFSTEKNGETFSKNLGLSEDFKSGEYIAWVYENIDKVATGFIYCGDDLNELSEQMKEMNDEQISQAVADNKDLLGIPEGYCESFASYIIDSGKSLKEGYKEAIVVSVMKSGDVESAVKYYGADYGIDYDEYINHKTAVKESVAKMIKNDKITNLGADYQRLLKEAVLANIETKDELREFVLSLDADFDDYEDLSEADKKTVINKLFNNMPKSVDLLIEKFEKYSADAGSDDSSSGSGGGGSSGGRGSVGGAVAGTHVGTVSGTGDAQAVVTFGDTASHWAKEYIEMLSGKKIVAGYANGMFYPNRNVTRAEFSKMVAVAMGIEPDAVSRAMFKDVSDADWHKPYVAAMAKAGIITGYEGYFRPDDYITREDMAVIICRALTYKGTALSGTAEFADMDKASDYATEAISKLGGSKIINGSNNEYRPKDMSTRAETSAVIARILTTF